jgi:integrase
MPDILTAFQKMSMKAGQAHIRALGPDGTEIRERKKAPVTSRSGAIRWGQARERQLLKPGRPRPKTQVPTLAEFAPVFLEGYAVANRQKPSSVAAKQGILDQHLIPLLGARPLDRISTEDVQRLKAHLAQLTPKTVNNVLSVLSVLLKVAVEWKEIDQMPCSIRLVKTMKPEAAFHDFEDFERLVEEARVLDWRAHVAVLLGGEAGLRCGEMLALEWGDVDLKRGQLLVQRSDWEGHVSTPKGGRPRRIPLTERLADGLCRHRHLKGPRVLCLPDGAPLTRKVLQRLIQNASKRAGLANVGLHVLRHTFCSHLAMRGAPARAIQDLAGHRDLSTTQRYMHLSPAAVDGAIRLLDRPPIPGTFGDILETGDSAKSK